MKFKHLFYVLIVLLIGFFVWSRLGRHWTRPYTYKTIVNFVDFKKDSATANIVGMQVYMTNLDYITTETFYNKLDYYLEAAQQKRWLKPQTTVVFPEHIATWLVAADEKKAVFESATVEGAMKTIVLSHLPLFLIKYVESEASEKSKDAVFQLKAKKMGHIYQDVFSELAKKYKVSIVGGSLFLPNPVLEKGKITVRNGPLFNVSALFTPDGRIEAPLILKKFPTADELSFCEPSKEPNKAFKINGKNIGILICADAWFPQNYRELNSKKASVLLVPAYSAGNNLWATKWKGYNKLKERDVTPKDIITLDIGKITEGAAWHKYTLVRSKNTRIKMAVAVFLRGKIWDLGTDGQSFIWREGQLKSVPKTEGPVLFNVEM